MTLNLQSCIKRAENQLSSELDEDLVILNTSNSVYYGLQSDPVAIFIWGQLHSVLTVEAVISRVCSEFSVDTETCRKDTVEFLENLLAEGLICEVEAKR